MKKATPYLIGLGVFTLILALTAELAIKKPEKNDFAAVGSTTNETVFVESTSNKYTIRNNLIPETASKITYSKTAESETYKMTKPETSENTEKTTKLERASKQNNAEPSTCSFRITVYTPSSDNGKWGYATSTGERSVHLKTCAVDPNVIPLGSTIEINGLTLRAVDTGSCVKGNVIDVFFDGTDEEAEIWLDEFGEQHIIYF